jgi:hypothetical protein
MQKTFHKARRYNYSISSDGKVTNQNTGRVLKTRLSRGYEVFGIGGKQFKVHRLVAEAFIPNVLHKPLVNHVDSNRANNNASNLEWTSHKENVAHAIASGRHKSVVNASAYRIIRFMLSSHTVEEVCQLTNLTSEEVNRFL